MIIKDACGYFFLLLLPLPPTAKLGIGFRLLGAALLYPMGAIRPPGHTNF